MSNPEKKSTKYAKARIRVPAMGLLLTTLPAPLVLALGTWSLCFVSKDPITGLTGYESEGIVYVGFVAGAAFALSLAKLASALAAVWAMKQRSLTFVTVGAVISVIPAISTFCMLDVLFAGWLIVSLYVVGLKSTFTS